MPKLVKILSGISAHIIMLRGMSVEGNVDAARKLLNEMSKKKIKSDDVSYTTVFNRYLKKGDVAR